MGWFIFLLLCVLTSANKPDIDPASRQLEDYKSKHPHPELLTLSSGAPVDIRQTNTLNANVLENDYFIDSQLADYNTKIPERRVHAKAIGVRGYFKVTNDVTKFTKIDAFNKIGKKTPVFVRASTAIQSIGGSDLERENRALAVKFYTKEGNWDLITLHNPIFFFKDPIQFNQFNHAFGRNPRTNLYDVTAQFDFLTKNPVGAAAVIYLLTDYGIPRGYRKMDTFSQHTYELYNEHGEKYYARFNFRSQQGIENFTSTEAAEIKSRDLDYFSRDLYNAIENKDYPSWLLEMDILSEHDLASVDFNPFDLTVLWPKGHYHTVPVGRMVLNENVYNHFAETEQASYCPSHLVPGTTGAPDNIFKARRLAYKIALRNRLGTNHEKIEVNKPLYERTYNRDGQPPVRDNGDGSPNYYPNSFNGPEPYVDVGRPHRHLEVTTTNAIDLKQGSYIYNHILHTEGERQRLADNIAAALVTVIQPIKERALKLFKEIDAELGERVVDALYYAEQDAKKRQEEQAEKDEISRINSIRHSKQKIHYFN